MPSLTGQPSDTGVPHEPDARAIARSLDAAYARARLEEVIRAVAEDALDPSRSDALWRDEGHFEAALREAVEEIAQTTAALLAIRLTDLLDTAPPRLADRLASVPRWFEDA
jgi:hypothetical protein